MENGRTGREASGSDAALRGRRGSFTIGEAGQVPVLPVSVWWWLPGVPEKSDGSSLEEYADEETESDEESEKGQEASEFEASSGSEGR